MPSVNMTMTFALLELGSKSEMALEKASAWLVLPAAARASTAFFRVSTEVMSCVLSIAVSAKLTMPIWLPKPIWPLAVPPVDSAMMSMKVLAPVFILASGVPVMLPERSSTRTMSVGFAIISGAAVSASVTRREPSQSIRSRFISLLEFVTPILCYLPLGFCIPKHNMPLRVKATMPDATGQRKTLLYR